MSDHRIASIALYLRESQQAGFSFMLPKERFAWHKGFLKRHGFCTACEGTGRDTWDRVTTKCFPCNGTGKVKA